MPSNFASFNILVDNDDGTTTPVPSQTVHVYDVTHSTALSDVTSDVEGHVPGDTLAVAAGTLIRFSASLADGRCGYSEVLTT